MAQSMPQMDLDTDQRTAGFVSGEADSARFAPFAAKLAQAGLPDLLQRSFRRAYRQLCEGATGYIFEEDIDPVIDLPRAANLDEYHHAGVQALARTVIIKLNGGLGTTMGMQGAKSLIEVKQGMTFLDIIWVHLPRLQDLLEQHGGILPLPLMRNEKTVDPTDPNSPAVYQLESAMGQAISLFPGAEALQTPRKRFLPVKDTNDLLAVGSDLYVLDHDYSLHPNPARTIDDAPVIELDQDYFGLIDQFRARFARSWPSLLACRHLSVKGDFYFGGDLVLSGHVTLRHDGIRPVRLAALET